MPQRSSSYRLGAAVAIMVISGWSGIGLAEAQQGRARPSASADTGESVVQPLLRLLERAHRVYQDDVIAPLSIPTGMGSPLPERRAPPAQVSVRPGGPAASEPGLLEQIQALLGMETAKAPGAPAGSQTAAEMADLEERMLKQKQARALEQRRVAEEQKLASDARRASEALDAATRQRQKAAEAARIAEDARRKAKPGTDAGGQAVAALETESAKPAGPAKIEDKQAGDDARRKQDAAAPATAGKGGQAEVPAAAGQRPVAAGSSAAPGEQAATKTEVPRAIAQAPKSGETEDGKPEPAVQNAKVAREQADAEKAQRDRAEKARADRAAREAAGRIAEAASKAADKVLDHSDKSGRDVQPAEIAFRNRPSAGHGKRANACARSGDRITPPGTYVVRAGDTLWGISRRHYDKGEKFGKIVRANETKISDPDLIFPCQRFHLPRRTALQWLIHFGDDADAS